MKKLILLSILSIPFFASAQKLEKPHINKSTSDTTLTTSRELLFFNGNLMSNSMSVKFWFAKNKNVISLVLYIQTMNGKDVMLVTDGQKANLTLSDNSTITLTTHTSQWSKIGVDQAAGVYSHGSLAIPYEISGDNLSKLKSLDLVNLKIELTASTLNCDIKPNNAGKLKKAADLITP